MPDRERRRSLRADRPLPDRTLELEFRADAIDRWRDRVDRRLDAAEDGIDGLKKADEIAQAVADKLGDPETQPRPTVNVGGSLNWPQKLGGIIVGGLVVADSLRGLFGL